MFLDIASTKSKKGKKYTRILLRQSYRENGKVKKKTIANLSDLPEELISVIKTALSVNSQKKSQAIADPDTLVKIKDISANAGLKFGSLYVLYTMLKQTGIASIFGTCQNSKLAIWLICARILFQGSRLKASRLSNQYAVKSIIGLEDVKVQALYDTLDWLCENQDAIEKKIMSKHPKIKELFLYDVTSSYFEGQKNELSEYGYNRDGKKGKKQIVIGLLTDIEGEPLSIEVFRGNITDPTTCSKQIEKIKKKYGAESITLVGDRGMIKEKQIGEVLSCGYNYITALTKAQIEKLIREEVFQMGLFEEELQEVISESIRYVLRRNPSRAEEIDKNRKDKLNKLKNKAEQRSKYQEEHKKAKEETGIKEIQKYAAQLKIEKWVKIIGENKKIKVEADEEKLKEVRRFDGCYAIKTNITDGQKISAKQIHERYKDLSNVEWAFRTMKTTLLETRPIYHRLESRTRAVCFISMLAYKVSRRIISELSKNKEELIGIMCGTNGEAKNQALPLDDILRELDMIQEVKLKANEIEIPIILQPTQLGAKILSILEIKLPALKAA
jgi:transposase